MPGVDRRSSSFPDNGNEDRTEVSSQLTRGVMPGCGASSVFAKISFSTEPLSSSSPNGGCSSVG
jgi:hypothetical protein